MLKYKNPTSYGYTSLTVQMLLLHSGILLGIFTAEDTFTIFGGFAFSVLFVYLCLSHQHIVTIHSDKIEVVILWPHSKEEYQLTADTNVSLYHIGGTPNTYAIELSQQHTDITHSINLYGHQYTYKKLEKHIRQNVEVLQQQKQATIA